MEDKKNKTILIKGTDVHSIRMDAGCLPDITAYTYYLVDNTLINEIEKQKIPTKYIINKGATILIWNDGTKTIVKRSEEDEYDKVKGFLWAYFQKHSGLSKNKANEYLKSLVDEDDLKAIKLIQNGKISETLVDGINGMTNALKNMANSLIGYKKVKIVHTGLAYTAYKDWINTYFPKYKKDWVCDSCDYDKSKTYNLIGTAKHTMYDYELALIQDPDSKQVFIFRKDGLEEV